MSEPQEPTAEELAQELLQEISNIKAAMVRKRVDGRDEFWYDWIRRMAGVVDDERQQKVLTDAFHKQLTALCDAKLAELQSVVGEMAPGHE